MVHGLGFAIATKFIGKNHPGSYFTRIAKQIFLCHIWISLSVLIGNVTEIYFVFAFAGFKHDPSPFMSSAECDGEAGQPSTSQRPFLHGRSHHARGHCRQSR